MFNISLEDDLRSVSMKVCTALHQEGITAVLTGGSAATVYAPDACQSYDADFIVLSPTARTNFVAILAALDYRPEGRIWRHDQSPFTLDFPDDVILIGSDHIRDFEVMVDGDLLLNILSPTDCVRDRLCHFYVYSDRSALSAAVSVAHAKLHLVNLALIEAWSERERATARFAEFMERLLDRK